MKQKVNYIKKVNIYKDTLPLWVAVLIKSLFITFLICCAFVAIFSFIYIKTPVDGKSMYPNLNAQCYDANGNKIEDANHDYVYINRFSGCDYGNIIVVKNPEDNDENKYVIKRLIAKDGDKIAFAPITNEANEEERTYKLFLIKEGASTVEIIEENYLQENESNYEAYKAFINYKTKHPENFTTIKTAYGEVQFLAIDQGKMFYVSDNRSNSVLNRDCLDYGAVSNEKFVGRVDIIVPEGKNDFSHIFFYYWHKIFG